MPPQPHHQPVALVIGASRGIGRTLALSLACPPTHPLTNTNTNSSTPHTVIVSAKTRSPTPIPTPIPPSWSPPDPNSAQSSIDTVAAEITLRGGHAIPLACDTRDTTAVRKLVEEVVSRFGRLDVLVYNSGAIWWGAVAETDSKRFELMWEVNVRGVYSAVQGVLPIMAQQDVVNPTKTQQPGATQGVGDGKGQGRIIVISPPIYSRFFRGKTAYAMGKIGMSVLVRGLAMDFERLRREKNTGFGLAVTALWPAVSIESAATERAVKADQDVRRDLRRPEIFGDAVLEILAADVGSVNGRLLLDEDWLVERGWTRAADGGEGDFERYAVVKGARPRRIMPKKLPSLEVEEQDDEGRRMDSTKLREAAAQKGKARL